MSIAYTTFRHLHLQTPTRSTEKNSENPFGCRTSPSSGWEWGWAYARCGVDQLCLALFFTDHSSHQAPLPMRNSVQEYWGELYSLLQDLPDAGIKPGSPALQGRRSCHYLRWRAEMRLGGKGMGSSKPQYRIGSYFCNKLLESSGSALTSYVDSPSTSFLISKTETIIAQVCVKEAIMENNDVKLLVRTPLNHQSVLSACSLSCKWNQGAKVLFFCLLPSPSGLSFLQVAFLLFPPSSHHKLHF